MTKELGYDILISEAIYKLVGERVDVIDLGQHQLRGRSAPIGLYALKGWRGDTDNLFDQVIQEWQQHQRE
jgi:adenylate cyclase